MTALTNPGSIALTSAYRTTNPVIPNSANTNGYVDGIVGTALGSVIPATPVFDGFTISALFQSVDATTGAATLCIAIPGALEQEQVFDQISFEFGDLEYQFFWYQAAVFSTTLIANYSVWQFALPSAIFGAGVVNVTFSIADESDDFNCNCSTGLVAGSTAAIQFNLASLVSLRTRMMIRLGYAAQAANPPPGMVAFCNEYLFDAQQQLDKKFRAQNLERYFRWTMVPGQRFYGIDKSEGGCTLLLDPYRISWCGFEDLNRAWYELIEGIPPVFYTRANINFGWPTRYEVRQCIEVFPAPQAEYKLWVRGQFGLQSFVNDTDITTFDSELVFLLALANAKASRGQSDAGNVMNQATSYLGALVAGSHKSARYIPKSKTQNPATPPRFIPLGLDQA